LAFALTDRSYTLAAACESFGVEHGKQKVLRHGKITAKYISYNRRDVLATSELSEKLLEEYQKHRVSLQATKAFSPASIGKSYLGDMGITPVLERQTDFSKEYLGYAQSAFYGGRSSAHIRKVSVPVVYTDFLSMYPTVNSLMGLWEFVVAREIRVRKQDKRGVVSFLKKIKASSNLLFKRDTWKELHSFVRIVPDGDILPSRSKYSSETNDWQVALNYLYAESNDSKKGLWYSLPDIVASVLLTGRIPTILEVFCIEPHGVLETLKPALLRSAIPVDPASQDFFRIVIEQRKLLQERTDISESERKRLDKALKVLANATGYGIYAQMDRQEAEHKIKVTCHGRRPEAYSCSVVRPEAPGKYCFPPFASLITGAARLMLALLEHSVTRLGGTYAMEDTDSMAIVATQHGGDIPCKGGTRKLMDGREAVRALTWKEVDGIAKKFQSLNPYNRSAIKGSILKIEDDNRDPKSGKQRQLYCLAISTKRYVLFVKDKHGSPTLLRGERNNKDDRWSEHGLGHLLNPSDPESEDSDWISGAWLNIVRKNLGLSTKSLGIEHLPAIGRISVSSPAVMKPFKNYNKGKKYRDQVKPFSFLSTCHVKQLGHPVGVNPEEFHLIAPYESNPRKWLKMDWIDQYSEHTFRITTVGDHGNRWTARVKNYGDVLQDYEFHPEAKCADAEGNPCNKQTIGLLQRRHVKIGRIRPIGKESNSLEDVDSGLVHSEQNVYTEYPNEQHEWEIELRPALKKAPLIRLVEKCSPRLSRRMLIDARAGRSMPHKRNQDFLRSILRDFGLLAPG